MFFLNKIIQIFSEISLNNKIIIFFVLILLFNNTNLNKIIIIKKETNPREIWKLYKINELYSSSNSIVRNNYKTFNALYSITKSYKILKQFKPKQILT